MERLSKGELKDLLDRRDGPCITLYMPTHDAGADIQQDSIRLKNLLRRAEEKLREKGMRAPEIDTLVKPARELLDLDRLFWRSPSASFAMFLASGMFRYYHLPLKVEEAVHVDDRFHLKPMIRMLDSRARFYVLALSQGAVRLFEGTKFGVRNVPLEGIPHSLDEALESTEFSNAQTTHLTRSATGGPGVRTGAFDTQGPAGDGISDKDDLLRNFFRVVDGAVRKVISDGHAPLILAGVNYLHPLYRHVNTYPYLMDSGVSGNVELLSPDQIHTEAWPIAREFLSNSEREAVARFANFSGSPRASIDLKEIVSGAHSGRVDTLFVAEGLRRWGRYDPGSDELTVRETADGSCTDLLDLAATQTFMTGGSVYVVAADAVPGGECAAALFRF